MPNVLSVAGPKFSEVFLPLTHWAWPKLVSSQPHVSLSNEQPTKSKLVSLTTRGEQNLKTQFCKQKSKIIAAPGQTPGVTAMSSTATKPLFLVSASMCSWTLKKRAEWLMRLYSSLSLRRIPHTWKGLVLFTDWENLTQLLPLLELWNTSWLSDGPERRYTFNMPESLSRNREMSISPPVFC